MILFFKTNFKLTLLFLAINFSFNFSAQSISDIKNIKVNQLNDAEVRNIKNEMDKKNISFETLENMAITNGMAPADFSILKARIESLTSDVNATNVESGVTISEKPIELDGNAIKSSQVFGSEIFNSSSLSFEPNPNMATPTNYILGPGDEIQIVIYGMQEFSGSFAVSKEGKISIPIVGQVFVNGLTFEAAKIQIKRACSKVYSSLSSGASSLSTSLIKIRSIKITILGARKPGNYTVSSISSVFNALHIAGGPNNNGTYRNIELLRGNKVIKKIDIYKFLTSGDQSDNINLLDNDVIRIPVYENRVKIEGKVKRAGIFELLPNETFVDLLRYCSGFDESAYKANIKLVQNTEKELKIVDLAEKDYLSYSPKLGDVFKVSTILNRIDNKVTIRGSVYRPDDYAVFDGMTLKDLILKADGLTEDAFLSKAILIREKSDLTKEIESVDLRAILDESQSLILRKNDELVINSLFDFKNPEKLSINGFVKKSGEFPFIEKLTLYDLILLAGGFTEGASKTIEISRVIIKDEEIKDQIEKSIIINVDIDVSLQDQTKNVLLMPYDIVQVRKKPIFEAQKGITIIGEVMYPGNYTISSNDERFLNFIERAGDLKNAADVNSIYIIRKTDRVSTLGVEKIERKIPLEYEKILKRPNSNKNIVMKTGDKIVIEKVDNTVKVIGSVYLNSEIPFVKNKKAKYYINGVGGYGTNANKRKIYIIEANGLGNTTKTFLFFRKHPNITAGCELIIPEREEKKDNHIRKSIAELSVISSAIASLSFMVISITNVLTKD